MSKDMSNPFISIDGRKNRVRIGVDVFRLLGMPQYVCLYNTVNCDSIAIGPCDEKVVISYKVPEKIKRGERCDCTICSKQFVDMIMFANHMQRDKTYHLNGVYLEDKNKITFSIAEIMDKGTIASED